MDALDMFTILIFCVFGLVVSVAGMGLEYIEKRAKARQLHRHVWGNVVDLRDWRNTQKRASGIKR